MPCYFPVHGWKARHVNATGKRSVVFNVRAGYRDLPVTLPCLRCIGCRLEYSRQWALRCMHEAQLHEENCFLTLTYDDEHLPSNGSLVPRDLTLFWKRLRKWLDGERVKYFACGEYGERTSRPHYHACVFGVDFPDKQLHKEVNGNRLYRSAALERLWGNGACMSGAVTFESAAYVARYVTKKVTGPDASAWYQWTDPETGEVHSVEPEFVRMSRRPAIAKEWFSRFADDTYSSDSVVARGFEMKPPKYYDKLLEVEDANRFKQVKFARARAAQRRKVQENSTPERLAVRRVVKEAQLTQLKREIE